jgi:hypothetical protein
VDVIAHLHVDTKHYRTQVEHELRAKLFRLRQQGAQVLSDPAALLKLCVDSVATFCTLGRHALAAGGIEVTGGRRDAVNRLREKLGAPSTPPSSPLDVLLDLREGKTGGDHVLEVGDAVDLFAEYLEFIRRMVEYVDRMEDHK